MATLSGQTIANTFDSLLHVEDDTAGLVATSSDSRVIQDGVGAASALALATDSVRITSTNKLYFNDVGGEYISGDTADLTITSGNDIKLAVGAAGSVHSAGVAGTSNTVLGVDAGIGLEAGSNYNVLIGDLVGDASMNDAVGNTCVGYSSGGALTTGDYNTFLGRNTGLVSQAVQFAVAIGNGAMDTGNADTDANGTVAIGVNALSALTSGAGNLAIGYQALATHTTGINNIAIGYQAMHDTDSTASSSASLTSQGNVIIGKSAGSGAWQDQCNRNIAIGELSLSGALVNSSNNICVGYKSGLAITTGDGNTLVGYQSGDVLATGDDNILIGRDVAMSGAGVDSEIVIGVGATGQGTNTATIGNSDCTSVYAAEDGDAVVYCGGINMSLNQAAAASGSMTSEHLDAYEEGTFDATLKGSDTDPTQAYHADTQSYYTKIGRFVFVCGRIKMGTVSNSPAGIIRLDDMPFTSSGDASNLGGIVIGYASNFGTTAGAPSHGYLSENQVRGDFHVYDNDAGNVGSFSNSDASDVQSASNIFYSVYYRTD